MNKKMLIVLTLVGILGILVPSVHSDAAWKSDRTGRWYTTKSKKGYVIGWKKIGKYKYYFNKDKYAVTGWKYISKKWYFFDAKGRMLRNIWVDGYYLQNDGSMAVNKTINGIQVNANGQIVSNNTSETETLMAKNKNYWDYQNDKWYYYDYKGQLAKGWLTIKDNTYYMDPSTGERASGVVKIDKKYYYFHPDTGIRNTGWQTYNNKTYYFSKSKYHAVTKWNKIKKKYYYFTGAGVLVKDKWINNSYYVDEKGHRSYGWLTLNGKKYYLNPQTGIKSTKWHTINKKKYCFKADGSMVTKKWVGGRYLQANGTMAANTWVGAYYVGKYGYKTGKTRSTGFYTSGGKTYYLSSTYQKVKGWVNHKNKYYYFNNKGVMLKNSWINNCYVNSNGVRIENQFYTIKKKKYLFLADGTKAVGSVTYNGKDYYFNSNGVMKTGFITINGNKFYFDPETGAKVKSSVLTIDGKVYYFDYNGYISDISDVTVGEQIAFYAQTFIGNPYKYGGTSLTNGADCSGFVQSILAAFDIKVPRIAEDQATGTSSYGGGPYATPKVITVSQLLPGDLVFYYSPISHVGIYIGNDQIVHASNSNPYPVGGIKTSAYNYTTIVKCVRYW